MPTFGYTTIGATSTTGASPAGTKFTAPESGTITKIWYYSFAGAATRTAVYADSAGSPAAKLAESTEVTPGNGVWAEYPLSLAITSGTVYWLMGWGCDPVYDTGDANQGGYQGGQTYPTWPDPFNETALNDVKLSIFAEYGQTARPSADSIDGSWTPSTGTDLYAVIDELTANDSDYIASNTGTGSDAATIALSAISTPVAGDVLIKVRSRGGG